MKGIASQTDILAIEDQGAPALPSSTYEMIRAGARIDPEAPALSFFLRTTGYRHPERWTYRDLLRDIHRTANLFTRLGARKDSVIAFLLPNLPETHFVIWGGEAAGIVCAINPLLEASAIADLLNAARAEILVTLAPFPSVNLWQKARAALEHVPSLKHLLLIDLADRVRGPARLAARFMQRRETARQLGRAGIRGAVPRHISVHNFNTEMRRENSAELNDARRFHPDDAASYFCTGGTTGLPKIAIRTHGNEVANAWSTGRFLGDGIGPGKVVFGGLPLFHVNAVLTSGLMPFSRGAHVVLGTPQGYRGEGVIEQFWRIVARYRVNFFSGVPTLYAALLEVPIGKCDLRSLEYGLCGAAPLPLEVFRTFQARTGIKILEGYGLTEGSCVSSANPPLGERRLGSVGLRIPLHDMKAVVLDESGAYVRDCAVGEIGMLVISGPNVFRGYLLPDQGRDLWVDLGDGRRWLNTGDLGRQDAAGYFWLTGRKKELIIRSGHNIDPAAIEEPLHRHPAVKLAAAVGRPDVHSGELPVAYVQLKPGHHASEAALAEFARAQIPERAAQPKHVRIVESLPLTGVGKIFKPELKRREIADALRLALTDAGVAVGPSSITVSESKGSGTVVQIELNRASQEDEARTVLGHFPYTIAFVPSRDR